MIYHIERGRTRQEFIVPFEAKPRRYLEFETKIVLTAIGVDNILKMLKRDVGAFVLIQALSRDGGKISCEVDIASVCI